MMDGLTGIADIYSLSCKAIDSNDSTDSSLSEVLIKSNSAVINTWMLGKAAYLCIAGKSYQLADFFLFTISMFIGIQSVLGDILSKNEPANDGRVPTTPPDNNNDIAAAATTTATATAT